MRRAAARILAGLALAVSPAGARGQLVRSRTLDFDALLASQSIQDVDGDGRAELITIERDGDVRVWPHAAAPDRLVAGESVLTLPDPRHCLVAIGDVLATDGSRQLVVASPAGVTAYPLAAAGGFTDEPIRVAGRARLEFRTRWPRLSNIAPDLNSDGRADLVLPDAGRCHLWLNVSTDGTPRLQKVGVFDIEVDRSRDTGAVNPSDELQEQFTLPSLRTRDVNGDGRPDLVLGDEPTRSFHLQRPDGTIPAEPDVRLDLTRFRDTTQKPESMFGGTAVITDDAVLYSRDLDGDAIPDYVIAQGRKVWVFHGTPQGPQFTRPSKTFMVDEDITYLVVAELNEDRRPDLLIFKLIVPSEAELVLGMLGPLTVEVRASGYASLDGRTFEQTPTWRRRLKMRFPPLAKILRDPQRYIEMFLAAVNDIPISRRGDFDGDGRTDVVMIRDEPPRLELWLGTEAETDGPQADVLLREVLFEQAGDVWDLDRMLDLIRWVGDTSTASITRGRAPDAVADLRGDGARALTEITVGDLAGDGRDEILAIYETQGDAPATTVDVFELRGDAPAP